ncbi:MAG: hypothetical protein M1823_003311 [Watsoniomyces obsoletus]|nr:MAG: hypothetical protein M1823_003311 [Watsoniomyces obsoletus]
MGWFSTSTPTAPPKRVSADGTPEAPSRNDRQHCWEARDAYFACLDRHDILDALKDEAAANKNCAGESQKFDMNCAQTWVKHFKQRRVAEYQRKKAIEKIEAQGGTVLPDPAASTKGTTAAAR